MDFDDFAARANAFADALRKGEGHAFETAARQKYRALVREWSALAAYYNATFALSECGATRYLQRRGNPVHAAFSNADNAEFSVRQEFYAFLSRNGPARERLAAARY